MSHRPYPSVDRALRQLGRHVQPPAPYAPGGIIRVPIVIGPTFAEAMSNLASWGDRWRPWNEAIDAAHRSQPMTLRRRIRAAVANILDGIDNFALSQWAVKW